MTCNVNIIIYKFKNERVCMTQHVTTVIYIEFLPISKMYTVQKLEVCSSYT